MKVVEFRGYDCQQHICKVGVGYKYGQIYETDLFTETWEKIGKGALIRVVR
jgi:hypothetical protein